jgi:DNA-binding HxlR family transcriptional regulator
VPSVSEARAHASRYSQRALDEVPVDVKPHNKSLCPKFQAAMEVLAKPWTGLIVATLAEAGALRFSELGERVPGIGDRMLSERLKELEGLAVVERRVLPGRPVGVEYELTEAGKAFGDVSTAMARWGEKLIAAHPPPAPVAKKAAGPKRKKGA